MQLNNKRLIYVPLIVSVFCLGGISVKLIPKAKGYFYNQAVESGLVGNSEWNSNFRSVTIKSSIDGSLQSAYFLAATEEKPLLVSLHAWSADFSETDPLSDLAAKHEWNYLHPDFRGPNWTKDACLSPLVISDIDDAIQYAIDHASVDIKNIFIVGFSGGGYATLGSYLRTQHRIKRFVSWAPISDLSAWYSQSLSLNNNHYADNILACTSSLDGTGEKVEARSPLFWTFPEKDNGALDIYAGINDGHEGGGSVPISHSLLFFNRLLHEKGLKERKVNDSIAIDLLTRAHRISKSAESIGDRSVIYRNITSEATLTIFDGGHEMLSNYTFGRLIELSKNPIIE